MLNRLKRWLRGAGSSAPLIAILCPFCGQGHRYCPACGSHQHDGQYHAAMRRENARMASAETGNPP